MTLPFKPHVIALVCSAGLFAASGVLYVKSRTPEVPVPAAPAADQAQTPVPAPAVKTTFTTAQIDQWVAPVALYPDPLLSQVLMASTYPANVVQAVQWSRDNPTLQGDTAIQAVASQPWDPSVKSLVAFPQLMALMGENPQWVQNLGDAFLAQPQDVMDAVQRLRLLAQQTGSLKSTPQQTVTRVPKTSVSSTTAAATTTSASTPAASSGVIKIEPANPQVVYVPNYNPATVYGAWPNTAYPPVYLPPPPGQQFADSFVKGFGYSLGVATTYALFSSIDWDDDDHHHYDDDHHHDDDDHHGGNGYQHNGDNININVNNFNRISGQNLPGKTMGWQHNPGYRNGLPYPNNSVAQHLHPTNVSGGLSATQPAPASRDSQRQAAMAQFQQRSHTANASLPTASPRDIQRKAASQPLNQIARRNNYRGYDDLHNSARRQTAQQHSAALTSRTQLHPLSQQQRNAAHQRIASSTPQQRQAFQQMHSNMFSGNDSRSPSWQSQQLRGQESRRIGHLNTDQRAAARERLSEHHEFHRR
ncbi:DUF3300 domain-containing protein [Salmonella bongori]|nr:DUF3300 domain-containing protein [Salmonella bongori]EDP8593317.1 DUF3300 domain-containing protein [Salmonella bongori]EDP8597320.1 DUF3300 domain-containing protein [Salmonella bongori]EDP8684693.1 DUF3300 domain-containing protein [Salmonella bongori]EDP8792595.1 DUF3300 domain-containing protein [Salmonella bongori]